MITVLDSILDSSGLLIISSSFRWRRSYYILIVLLEMAILSIISPLLSYFFDWNRKLDIILAIVSSFSMITYFSDPFVDMESRWFDHLGRTMVIFVITGLIASSKHDGPGSSPIYNTWSSNSFDITLQGSAGTGIVVVVDITMTIYVYAFTMIALYSIGAFSILQRFVRGWRYSLHVSVLNFLVRKLTERVVGAENLSIGLTLARQWDDLLTHQRHRYLLSVPDVQPPYLLNLYEKLYYIQIAAFFNMRIPLLKSNLGLNLLHVSMNDGSGDVCRWLIYRYPDLNNEQNYERDTPVMIAIKEAAKHLFEYSLINNGVLDDGTSYDDDFFREIYPEYDDIREDYQLHGDFIVDKKNFHSVTAKELNMIERDKCQIKFKHKYRDTFISTVDSKVTDLVRYPEDGQNEDKDSGSLICWSILGVTVPSVVLYPVSEDGYSFDAENEYLETKNISAERIHFSDPRYVIKRRNRLRRQLKEWDLRRSKTIDPRGRFPFTRFSHSGMDEDIPKESQNCRWNICRYAEILLSLETRAAISEIQWDVVQFYALGQTANRIQGRLVQQLAFVFNLNPPEGIALLSHWSAEISRESYIEGINDSGNALIKTIVAFGQMIESLESNFNVVGERVKRILLRQQAKSHVQMFNDRVIHYLAECMVSSSECLNLDDNQLSGPGRIAWRAICRALRRSYCSFILPSVYVSQRPITMAHISLRFNSLDCADCLLLAEVVKRQQALQFLDISHNRIGSRGLLLLLAAVRGHRMLSTLKLSHNRIGPAVGADLGLFIADNRSLKVFDVSNNKLGEMIRFSTSLSFESIPSAGAQIFRGLRDNNSLQYFDASFNNLGETSFDTDNNGSFIQGNTALETLVLSGNAFGPRAGSQIILSLAGWDFRTKSLISIDSSSETSMLDRSAAEASRTHSHLRSNLRVLKIAHNMLDPDSGSALSVLLKNSQFIHVLDVSGNAIGSIGGLRVVEALKSGLRIREREIVNALGDYPISTLPGIAKAKGFSLHTLEMSQCSLGPNVLIALMECVSAANCTIVNLALARNPFGVSPLTSENAFLRNKSLIRLDLSESFLQSSHLVPLLGGLSRYSVIVKLILENTTLDSSACFHVARVVELCDTLRHINLHNALMGPKGGFLVCKAVEYAADRLLTVDLGRNRIGSLACVPLSLSLAKVSCVMKSLVLLSNDICDDGTIVIAKALLTNNSLIELDLGENGITHNSAEQLSTSLRGKYEDGRKISNIRLQRFLLNNNPLIGAKGARKIVAALSVGVLEHVEIENIGLGEGSAALLARGLRDASVRWKYLNCAENSFGREGLNKICWSLRVNSRIKVIILRNSRAGQAFGSPEDALGNHGISLERMLRENIIIRSLDLSYNNLSSQTGIILFRALISNSSIARLCLRGNLFDDDVHNALGDLTSSNDSLKELDLGDNKLGYRACYSLATGLSFNNSIIELKIDSNRFGYFKSDAFVHWSRMIAYNTTLRMIDMDNNRVGPAGGALIAESLVRNSNLVSISLQSNRLDSTSGREIVSAFRNSRVLMDLFITEEEVGNAVWEEYVESRAAKRALTGEFVSM